jgi:hypothetical protein
MGLVLPLDAPATEALAWLEHTRKRMSELHEWARHNAPLAATLTSRAHADLNDAASEIRWQQQSANTSAPSR